MLKKKKVSGDGRPSLAGQVEIVIGMKVTVVAFINLNHASA